MNMSKERWAFNILRDKANDRHVEYSDIVKALLILDKLTEEGKQNEDSN